MKKKLFRKFISVILAVVMLAAAMPVAFAAEPVALTSANVVAWPTANGELYFGQKISDGVTLSGGTVTSDGTENGTIVSGHFEFIDSDFHPTSSSSAFRASIKFIPDDTQNYSGFEINESRDVTFPVNKTTPVLVDENDLPIATEVEQGAKLSTSTLSGGQIKNPYNPEEPKALAGVWKWAKGTTVVNESGYYEARITVSGYERLTQMVYVRVIGDTPVSVIDTIPSVEFTYNPDITWKDYKFEGGKAVIKDTTTEVVGTFSVTSLWEKVVPKVGSYEIDVIFTPDDETVALPCEFKVPVTVNKAVPKFKADGESDIPTITMPYGTKLDSSLDFKITPLVDVDAPVYLSYKDMNGNEFPYNGSTPVVGTHEIQVKVNVQDSNYEQYTMLTFKLEITGFTANCIMKPIGSQGYKILDTSLKYDAAKPTGTFTVSYTADGVKQSDITVKYGELFQAEKSKSGKYEFTVKYNEIENDPFEIADITYSDTVTLSHNVTVNGQKQVADYNTIVTASAPATDPAQPDKPYYGFAGWEAKGIDISKEQAASAEISFTMPDNDVELNANYKFSIKLFFEWICEQIVSFFNFIINAVKDLFALAA